MIPPAAGNGTRRDPGHNDGGAGPIEEWPLTALLRGARSTFGSEIRRALADGGYDDLPPNGPYVIGAIARTSAARSSAARTSAPLAAVVRQLGVSKQAAGQLVDTLVVRGYLDRSVDPADRRRLLVALTDRGLAAAGVIRTAADAVEAELQAAVGDRRVSAMREALAVLVRDGLVRDGLVRDGLVRDGLVRDGLVGQGLVRQGQGAGEAADA